MLFIIFKKIKKEENYNYIIKKVIKNLIKFIK